MSYIENLANNNNAVDEPFYDAITAKTQNLVR